MIILSTSGRAFLHYSNEFKIDWPESAVAIVGPNGTGKTTAARALIWSFIGRFPTTSNITKWTMDLPRPGKYMNVKKSPDTVVSTKFQVRGADGSKTGYTITRRLTWDKKISLTLESEDGVIKLEDKVAQQQIFIYAGVSHGDTVDECSKMFINKHWFGVNQTISIFSASATARRELLESTNPLALLPRLDDSTSALLKSENKLRASLSQGLSSGLGSISYLWSQILNTPLETEASGELLRQADLDLDAHKFIESARQRVQAVVDKLAAIRGSFLFDSAKAALFIERMNVLKRALADSPFKDFQFRKNHRSGLSSLIEELTKDIAQAEVYQATVVQLQQLNELASALAKDKALTDAQISACASSKALIAESSLRVLSQGETLKSMSIHMNPDPSNLDRTTVFEIEKSLAGLMQMIGGLPKPAIMSNRAVSSEEIEKGIRILMSAADQAKRSEAKILEIDRALAALDSVNYQDLSESLTMAGFGPSTDDLYREEMFHTLASARSTMEEMAALITGSPSGLSESKSLLATNIDSITLQTEAVRQVRQTIDNLTSGITTLAKQANDLSNKQAKRVQQADGELCDECGAETSADHFKAKSVAIGDQIESYRAEMIASEKTRSSTGAKLDAMLRSLTNSQLEAKERAKAISDSEMVAAVESSKRDTLARFLRKSASAAHGIEAYKLAAFAAKESSLAIISGFANEVKTSLSELGIPIDESRTSRYSLLLNDDGSSAMTKTASIGEISRILTSDLTGLSSYRQALLRMTSPLQKRLMAAANSGDELSSLVREASANIASTLDQTSIDLRAVSDQCAQDATDVRSEIRTATSIMERMNADDYVRVLRGERFKDKATLAINLSENLLSIGLGKGLDETTGAELISLSEAAVDGCSSILAFESHALVLKSYISDLFRFLSEASGYAIISTEKNRKIEALENLKSLLSPNGVARTMVLSSVASMAFEEANKSIKSLDLAKDLHIGVEVVSIAKDDLPPQPALDIIFTVDGQKANLPSNSQALQVSLALDIAVQSQGGWDGFFIVDEPEQGLDSHTRGKISSWLRCLGRQVIVLTNFGADNFETVISTQDIHTESDIAS